ncbi:MAG: hypothetical protein Q4E65_00595 [Clostridia bacterium]|nr:hypothetical protein [Clostridia bacterium]
MKRITRLIAILMAALFIGSIFFSIFASAALAKSTPAPTASPTPTPWQSLGTPAPTPTAAAVTPQPPRETEAGAAASDAPTPTPGTVSAKGDVWGSISIPGGRSYSIYSNRSDGKGGYYYNKDYNHIFSMTPQNAQVAVIMGHNMRKSGKMFHALHHVQNAWLGKGKCERCGASCTASHKASSFDLSYDGYKKWDLVCFYETESSEPASTLSFNALSTGGVSSWLDYQLSRAGSSKKGMTVGTASSSDKLMILITCGDKVGGKTGARLYMVLKAA